jgi:hypothetical protein
MNFPPVRPLPTLEPWSQPQTLDQLPRPFAPATGPIVGRNIAGAMQSGDLAPDVQTVRDPHRYARLSGSARLNVGIVSGLILASPSTLRNFLVIRNASATANIFVDFGISADPTRTPIRLIPNAMLIFDDVVPQDDIFAIADAAGGVVGISFSNVNFAVPLSLTGV